MALILKGPISLNKNNLQPYIYKFNVALIFFFIAWFVLCVPIAVAIGYVYSESPVTYITMGVCFGVLFNFLDKRNFINYEENRDFAYLKTDKKNFCRSVFGFKLK